MLKDGKYGATTPRHRDSSPFLQRQQPGFEAAFPALRGSRQPTASVALSGWSLRAVRSTAELRSLAPEGHWNKKMSS